jgi:sugar/nucleoside kinase (ribokinase family)
MEKIFDVLVVGELNVDLILDEIEKFPEVGKEVLAKRMTLTLGSSSAIFAGNISSLGARVAFIGKIGEDRFGDVVLECLQSSGVDVSMIKTDKQWGTGATIVLNVGEDRAMTTYPGAMDYLSLQDISDDDFQKAGHLHFSSYFLQPGMWGTLGELFRKAKRNGMTTSFDMQWDPKETWNLDAEDVLPHVDVFLPNENELMCLTGKDTLQDAIDSVKQLTNILAIKRGNKGSIVYHNGQMNELPAFLNEEVVDAIGAGDSFNAGFIYRFIRGDDVGACQRFANLTGAVSTTAAGGTGAFRDYEKFKKVAREKFGYSVQDL